MIQLISKIADLGKSALGFGKTVTKNKTKRLLATKGDETQREGNTSKEFLASMEMVKSQYMANNRTKIESFVGAFNSLIRPLIAILLIVPIVMYAVGFTSVLDRIKELGKLPAWYITLTMQIILAFFGLREFGKTVGAITKAVKSSRPMTDAQFNEAKKMIEQKSEEVKEKQDKIIAEKQKVVEILNSVVDENGDGLDDRGINQIKKHEGLRLKVYKCTAGKNTIAYGRNLDDKGVSKKEAEYLLCNDVRLFKSKVLRELPWVKKLCPARQWVLFNMAFNMGYTGLFKWKNTLSLIEEGKYSKAAKSMLRSKWAKQVKSRSKDLAEQMKTGRWVG